MKKVFIIIGIVLIVISYYHINNEKNEYENIYIEENALGVQEVEKKEEKIKIHISGEVVMPGLYEVKVGTRVDDAIRYAGGATVEADLDKINLAYELSDGEKIYIPSIFDEESEYTSNSGMENSTKKVNINKANSEELQTINGIGPSLAGKIVNYRKENGKFSTIEDLKNVPGIGDKKFENIRESIVVK